MWARFNDFAPDRRFVLMIRGVTPDPDHLLGLADALPHLDMAFVHLPGFHSPFFSRPFIADFALAFDEVAETFAPDRPLNIIGMSIGGLVAMAMRAPRLRSILAVDTPLSTGGLWPLRESLTSLGASGSQLAEWIEVVFGFSRVGWLNRDYRDLLTGLQAPTRMLLGSDPLDPERAVSRIPSLVSETDRAFYRAHPRVGSTLVGDTGHNIPRDGQEAFIDTIYRLMGGPPT